MKWPEESNGGLVNEDILKIASEGLLKKLVEADTQS